MVDALVVPEMVVVGDEVTELLLEFARRAFVLEQYVVLESLMPGLDLVVGLGLNRPPPDMVHALLLKLLSPRSPAR